MDLTKTIEADSTQVNADDLTGAPRTVTITGVSRGTVEQPVNLELAEFPGRAYRPCKSMRRVLVAAWGPKASEYIGRRMTLFNDQTVKWGGQAVGGVRIKALSHIDKPLTIPLTVTRGKRAPYTVQPLPDDEPASKPVLSDEQAVEFAQAIADASTMGELTAVAADLKAVDLGSHRDSLLAAWNARRDAIGDES